MTKNVRSKRKLIMTFVIICFDIMNGTSLENASFEPESQMEKNQAALGPELASRRAYQG